MRAAAAIDDPEAPCRVKVTADPSLAPIRLTPTACGLHLNRSEQHHREQEPSYSRTRCSHVVGFLSLSRSQTRPRS